jgi:hypothetical protein
VLGYFNKIHIKQVHGVLLPVGFKFSKININR